LNWKISQSLLLIICIVYFDADCHKNKSLGGTNWWNFLLSSKKSQQKKWKDEGFWRQILLNDFHRKKEAAIFILIFFILNQKSNFFLLVEFSVNFSRTQKIHPSRPMANSHALTLLGYSDGYSILVIGFSVKFLSQSGIRFLDFL